MDSQRWFDRARPSITPCPINILTILPSRGSYALIVSSLASVLEALMACVLLDIFLYTTRMWGEVGEGGRATSL